MTSNMSLQEFCGFEPSAKLLGYELEERMSTVSIYQDSLSNSISYLFLYYILGKQSSSPISW